MPDRVTRVTLSASVNGYISDMARAQVATKKTGTEAEQAADRFQKQSAAMTDVGIGLTAVGAVAAVAFGIAVSKAAEFDKAMSSVQAATQSSAGDMGLLRDAALDAGARTVYTATEAANAIEELGKNGLTTAEILNGGLDTALSVAAAGQVSVARAAEIAAVTMKQFNLEAEDLPHLADLLAAGAGKAAGDLEQMAQALNQAALVAAGTGLSVEETTGTLAAFADAGLVGSDAGTSFKNMLQRLTPVSGAAEAEMKRLGISAYDAQGNFIGAADFAGVLQDKLAGLTDEQRNATLAQIFGSDAVRAANVLYEQGAEGIQKYIDQTNDSGYAAKVAADRLNNLSGDVEKLGGALDTTLIRSGSAANDALRALTQGATGVVDAVGQMPEPILGAALGLTGLVAVVGLTGGAALIAVPKIAQMKLALSTLNVSGSAAARGIGLASGALALAGAAFAIWAQRQAEATSTAAEFADSLDQTTGAVTDYTRELVAKKLAESGAFEGAKNAGISQRELTDAVLQGGSAVDALRQKLYDYANANPFDPAIANSVNTVNLLSEGLERADQNLDDQAAAADRSSDSTDDAAGAYKEAADKASELQSNLRTLIDTINEANGVGQDAVSSNATYRSALAGIAEEVQRQKDAYEELNGSLDGFTLTLDETTESGSSNASMLADVAGKAQAAALAQFDLDSKTMSGKDAADKYAGTLAEQRQAFIDSALGAGFNAEQVQALADKVFALPSKKQLDILASTASAQGTIDRFIWANDGRRINLIVDGVVGRQVSGSSMIARANGGRLPGRPSSRDNMIIAAATGEYVVNARQTEKNLRALDYINSGGTIQGFATGGQIGPQYASAGSRSGSGGGYGGVVELGPRSLRALSREVINLIGIDQYSIASAASAGNANAAWRGGNS